MRLRDLVEKYCATRRKALSDSRRRSTGFAAIWDGLDEFLLTVSEDSGEHRMLRFDLRECGIVIAGNWDSEDLPATLTGRMNDEGEWRFAINGEGEYLRWQVARRTVQPYSSTRGWASEGTLFAAS